MDWTRDEHKAIHWAKLITDWHEDFSPNDDLARAMDLHNNKMGRNLFEFQGDRSLQEGIAHLKELVPKSKKIKNIVDLKDNTDGLVHITDS